MGPAVEKTAVQKLITSVGQLVFGAVFVIMTLDHRFGWSPVVPAYLSILGDVLGRSGFLRPQSRRSCDQSERANAGLRPGRAGRQ